MFNSSHSFSLTRIQRSISSSYWSLSVCFKLTEPILEIVRKQNENDSYFRYSEYMGKTRRDVNTDVCIVGAGPHGLAQLLFERIDPSIRVVVLDQSNEWLKSWKSNLDRQKLLLYGPRLYTTPPRLICFRRLRET